MSDPHYRELCQRLDQKFSEIRDKHPTQFACKQGCHSCCKPGLTVNRLERESIKEYFLSRPDLQEEARALEASDPFGGKRCRFLDAAGSCLVYEVRPLVCRSHGAPLQMRPLDVQDKKDRKDENLRMRDVCPLNFKEENISTLPPESVLNLDTLNTLLALVTKRAYPKDESRTALSLDAVLNES